MNCPATSDLARLGTLRSYWKERTSRPMAVFTADILKHSRALKTALRDPSISSSRETPWRCPSLAVDRLARQARPIARSSVSLSRCRRIRPQLAPRHKFHEIDWDHVSTSLRTLLAPPPSVSFRSASH